MVFATITSLLRFAPNLCQSCVLRQFGAPLLRQVEGGDLLLRGEVAAGSAGAAAQCPALGALGLLRAVAPAHLPPGHTPSQQAGRDTTNWYHV